MPNKSIVPFYYCVTIVKYFFTNYNYSPIFAVLALDASTCGAARLTDLTPTVASALRASLVTLSTLIITGE